MTTRRLVWDMTWRGAGCGLATGLGLGVLPGFLCIALGFTSLLFGALFYPNTRAPEGEATFGIFVLVFLILIGGAILGTVIGLVAGIICGFLIGLLTSLVSGFSKNKLQYHIVIAGVSIVLALFLTLPLFIAIYTATFSDLGQGQGADNFRNSFFAPMVVLPVMIGVLITLIIGQFIALWYENEMKKEKLLR